MIYTAESNFSNFVIEYLVEIEAEFENTLACLFIRGPDGLESWKKNGGQISWHTPFNTVSTYFLEIIKYKTYKS